MEGMDSPQWEIFPVSEQGWLFGSLFLLCLNSEVPGGFQKAGQHLNFYKGGLELFEASQSMLKTC